MGNEFSTSYLVQEFMDCDIPVETLRVSRFLGFVKAAPTEVAAATVQHSVLTSWAAALLFEELREELESWPCPVGKPIEEADSSSEREALGFWFTGACWVQPPALGRRCCAAGAMVDQEAIGVSMKSLAIGYSSSGRRSYAQIISESKPPPTVSIGVKSPGFTDSGEPTVFFTQDEVGMSIAMLKHAVIVRCAYGGSSIPELKSCLSQRLGLKEDFTASSLNHRHLLLSFEVEEDYLKVILRRSLK
ncbi:hypothetical protein Taro_024836 [Colocasia esculenta]|uniref:Uncharacterized protein n=1 Tax=Colocasia esculenta TaxID=4460 RepID=A0A843VFQ0_COLES|nr:hypothetical protein [Colocasia esculenta]